MDGRRVSGSGPIDPLLSYFLTRGARAVAIVEQPHPHAHTQIECTLEIHRPGKNTETVVHNGHRRFWFIPPEERKDRTYLRLKLRDILAAFHFFAFLRKTAPDVLPIDYVFAVESLNVLIAATAKRRLGARSIIYYIFDWAPRRYASNLVNRLYLWLDRMACRSANWIWNISPRIARARAGMAGYAANLIAPQVSVPFGADFRPAADRPDSGSASPRVLYSGGLIRETGARFLPDIARLLWRSNPAVTLVVAGEGDLFTEETVRSLAEEGVKNIDFRGYIPDRPSMDALACSCDIGLAPYPDVQFSTKPYVDVSKVRTYFACGLPVVCTDVVAVSDEISANELGLVCRPDPRAISDTVIRLCTDTALRARCRSNVLAIARHGSWQHVFDRAFEAMHAQRAGASVSR